MATHDGTIFDLFCVPVLELNKGEAVTYYPFGAANTGQTGGAAQPLTGVLVDQSEEMSPERSGLGIGDGDGVWMDNRNGYRIRLQARLEVPISLAVREDPNPPSEWLVRGEYWVTVRVEGRDESKQTVRVVRRSDADQTTARPRLRQYGR